MLKNKNHFANDSITVTELNKCVRQIIENNIGDLLTRGESPGKLDFESEWQKRPKSLLLPIKNWPIRQDCIAQVLPEQSEIVMKTEISDKIIVPGRFISFVKLIKKD